MATQERTASDQGWQQVLDTGDEKAFRSLVEPYTKQLIEAARHDLDYYLAQGQIHAEDFTPEEVAGEALIKAWDGRGRRPQKMSLRGWLLGNLYRTLRTMVETEREYRDDKAISLDNTVLPDANNFDVEEEFWEWYQPDDGLMWEDIIPANEPVDIEVPLYASRETQGLDADARHVLIMHDEFELSIEEVASVMNRALTEIGTLLEEARVGFRAQMGSGRETGEFDHPAPPEGSDQ